MRNLASLTLALLLVYACLGNLARAFDIEEEQHFPTDKPSRSLRILSNTDLNYFAPLIHAYQKRHTDIEVLYTVASSKELYQAIYEEGAPYDLVISSAMDLQVKLVNDGLSRAHSSSSTEPMPGWAKWRNHLFAFTQEPAVLLASKQWFKDSAIPQNRQELISQLRNNPDRFMGKIGTYDIRESGAGYLFATQDARQSDAYWRLAEVFGALKPKLYCCSSKMLDALESGEIAMAYNVVGSYASAVLNENSNGFIVPLSDYTHFMLRTALIPAHANNPETAGEFIDFLVGSPGRKLIQEQAGLPPINGEALAKQQHFRPITLGPGLLVYLDKIKRQRFLKEWTDAMIR